MKFKCKTCGCAELLGSLLEVAEGYLELPEYSKNDLADLRREWQRVKDAFERVKAALPSAEGEQ